jgi:hypothetical protein
MRKIKIPVKRTVGASGQIMQKGSTVRTMATMMMTTTKFCREGRHIPIPD